MIIISSTCRNQEGSSCRSLHPTPHLERHSLRPFSMFLVKVCRKRQQHSNTIYIGNRCKYLIVIKAESHSEALSHQSCFIPLDSSIGFEFYCENPFTPYSSCLWEGQLFAYIIRNQIIHFFQHRHLPVKVFRALWISLGICTLSIFIVNTVLQIQILTISFSWSNPNPNKVATWILRFNLVQSIAILPIK